jgi:competence protein ComEC
MLFFTLTSISRTVLIGLMGALFFAAGAWRYSYTTDQAKNLYTYLNKKQFSLEGEVISIESRKEGRIKQLILLRSSSVCLDKEMNHSLDANFQLYLTKPSNLQVGDVICVHNLTTKKTNDSYERYLIKEQIAASFFASNLEHVLICRPSFSFKRFLHNLRENVLMGCKKKLSKKTFSFFSSVFLGNKSYKGNLMQEPKEHCKTWGISHYLARSGLHMVIFVYILSLLINAIPVQFFIKQLILIFIGTLYYLLSWPSISFIRAFASFLLFKACALSTMPSLLIHVLSIITIAVLLHNPIQLLFLDFQLSFGLTCALAWFNHIANQKSLIHVKY